MHIDLQTVEERMERFEHEERERDFPTNPAAADKWVRANQEALQAAADELRRQEEAN